MKSTIKIFAIFAMVVGFAVGAKAQVSDHIVGTAEVMSAITITPGNSLDFKNVTAGNNKTISFNDVVSPSTTKTGGETTGFFTVTKGTKTQVTLSLNLPGNLASGANNLKIEDYTARLRTGGTAETPTSSVIWTSPASSIATDSSTNSDFFNAGSFIVDIGATVKPTSSPAQPSGTYTANITLTATYN